MMVTRDTVVLTGEDLAVAISAYLVAHEVNIHGPRTIRVIVDPESESSKKIPCYDVDIEVVVGPEGRLIDNR